MFYFSNVLDFKGDGVIRRCIASDLVRCAVPYRRQHCPRWVQAEAELCKARVASVSHLLGSCLCMYTPHGDILNWPLGDVFSFETSQCLPDDTHTVLAHKLCSLLHVSRRNPDRGRTKRVVKRSVPWQEESLAARVATQQSPALGLFSPGCTWWEVSTAQAQRRHLKVT